jgi:hypothetical protein
MLAPPDGPPDEQIQLHMRAARPASYKGVCCRNSTLAKASVGDRWDINGELDFSHANPDLVGMLAIKSSVNLPKSMVCCGILAATSAARR